MKDNVYSLLNEQVTKEFYSAYLYLAISNWFEEKNLGGFASWYKKQADEEMEHAMKLIEYLHDNGEKVVLGALEAPQPVFAGAIDAVKAALAHEKYITASIETIYAAAAAANDFRTQIFLQWFITEQGEEEKNANDMVDNVAAYGDHPMGLYNLDKAAGAR